MELYLVPGTEMKVSRIALGCMTMGGNWTKSPLTAEDERRANTAVDTALECGINFFDHADFYSCYKSDEVFGRFLKQRKGLRDKIIIQSKCGIRPSWETNTDKVWMYDLSYEHIINAVEGILKRLGVDYIDSLLLHRPDPLCNPDEINRAFTDLIKQGKVKYFGVSNYSAMQIELLKKSLKFPLIFNQLRLNALFSAMINGGVDDQPVLPGDPLPATITWDYCRLYGIIIQAYSPEQLGYLSGRILDGEMPSSRFASRIWDIQKAIKRIAQAHNSSTDTVVLSWLFKLPHTVQPVIGTTNPKRIKDACLAINMQLSREEWYEIYTAGRGGQIP